MFIERVNAKGNKMIRVIISMLLLVGLLSGCGGGSRAKPSVGVSKTKGQKATLGVGVSRDVGKRGSVGVSTSR